MTVSGSSLHSLNIWKSCFSLYTEWGRVSIYAPGANKNSVIERRLVLCRTNRLFGVQLTLQNWGNRHLQHYREQRQGYQQPRSTTASHWLKTRLTNWTSYLWSTRSHTHDIAPSSMASEDPGRPGPSRISNFTLWHCGATWELHFLECSSLCSYWLEKNKAAAHVRFGEAGKQQPVCSSGPMITDREAEMHGQQFVHTLLSAPGFSPTDQRALKTTWWSAEKSEMVAMRSHLVFHRLLP